MASIEPENSRAARAGGLEVVVEASEHSTAGLVAAVASLRAS